MSYGLHSKVESSQHVKLHVGATGALCTVNDFDLGPAVCTQLPTAPEAYGDAADQWTSDVNIINEVCGFPRSLVKCACLRRLSLRWTDSGMKLPSVFDLLSGNDVATLQIDCQPAVRF